MRTRPDIISKEIIDGRTVSRDEAGYLIDSEEWNKAVAVHFAKEEGIVLQQEHFTIIEFMRGYLDERGVTADARFVYRFLAERHNESQSRARLRFFKMFPYGYVKQTCKIAGMRQPRAFSTG
ncbi:MAG: TusE/DsrC/DsvC family sulfur relay protein [Hyphomicrobiales bacterium]|nr:TusE/DsrC/DsvC family sulfur relay protein [Hyphomicrobiales bacterium]